MVLLADILRYLIIGEMVFSAGFVLAPLLSLLFKRDKVFYATALGILCYSIAGIALVCPDLGKPLDWHIPILFVAASSIIAREYFLYKNVKDQ